MAHRRRYAGSGGRKAETADLLFLRVLCTVVTFVSVIAIALSRSTEAAVLVSAIAITFLIGAVFPRTVPSLLAKAIALIATLAVLWEPPSSIAFHVENLGIALPMWLLAALLHFPGVWRAMLGLLSPRPGKVSGNSMRVVD